VNVDKHINKFRFSVSFVHSSLLELVHDTVSIIPVAILSSAVSIARMSGNQFVGVMEKIPMTMIPMTGLASGPHSTDRWESTKRYD